MLSNGVAQVKVRTVRLLNLYEICMDGGFEPQFRERTLGMSEAAHRERQHLIAYSQAGI